MISCPFVISTKALKASTISWWGKRRWQIEGWFKTAKHRFGLHRFGQGTLLGVYRWLVLSLISYVLAHWAYLSTAIASTNLPDWRQAPAIASKNLPDWKPQKSRSKLYFHTWWCYFFYKTLNA